VKVNIFRLCRMLENLCGFIFLVNNTLAIVLTSKAAILLFFFLD
jgi:hypothetical protein